MIDLAKGDRTRGRILDEAVDLASVQGLGGMTIGAAARHFGELQSLIVGFARATRPKADAEATAAAVTGLAMSHLVRVRLLGERRARAVTMRAFDALLADH